MRGSCKIQVRSSAEVLWSGNWGTPLDAWPVVALSCFFPSGKLTCSPSFSPTWIFIFIFIFLYLLILSRKNNLGWIGPKFLTPCLDVFLPAHVLHPGYRQHPMGSPPAKAIFHKCCFPGRWDGFILYEQGKATASRLTKVILFLWLKERQIKGWAQGWAVDIPDDEKSSLGNEWVSSSPQLPHSHHVDSAQAGHSGNYSKHTP